MAVTKNLSDLEGLGYVGTPYSKFPGGIYPAFIAACQVAGALLEAGARVYSPIAHTHPIALYAGIDPLAHSIWLPFDQAIMDRADYMIVAMLPTWEKSYGIGEEIKIFARAGKPIYYLDPKTMELFDAPPAKAEQQPEELGG